MQVRTEIGDIFEFSNFESLKKYYDENKDLIVKISFDAETSNSNSDFRHRFVKTSVDEFFQRAIMSKCKKFFPIGTVIFSDIPLSFMEETRSEVEEYMIKYNIEFYQAFDCVNVVDAFEDFNFMSFIQNNV